MLSQIFTCDKCGKQVQAELGSSEMPGGWDRITGITGAGWEEGKDICRRCSHDLELWFTIKPPTADKLATDG